MADTQVTDSKRVEGKHPAAPNTAPIDMATATTKRPIRPIRPKRGSQFATPLNREPPTPPSSNTSSEKLELGCAPQPVLSLPTPPSSSHKPSQPPFPEETEELYPKSSSLLVNSTNIASLDETEGEPNPTPDPTPSKLPRSQRKPRKPALPNKRPSPGQKSKSDPTPQKSSPKPKDEPLRADAIDQSIEEKLKTPTKCKKDIGFVYVIVASIEGNPVIKIGQTAEIQVRSRIKSIKCNCKVVQFEVVPKDSLKIKRFYKQVEQLSHKELENFKYEFPCCGTKHKEYFTVDYVVARDVVERWDRLCKLGVYTKDWKLTDEWKFHLRQFSLANYGKSQDYQEEIDDHAERGRRWETFLLSDRSDWLFYQCEKLREKTLERPSSWKYVVVYFAVYWFFCVTILFFSSRIQFPLLILAWIMDHGQVVQDSWDWVCLVMQFIVQYARISKDWILVLMNWGQEKDGKIARDWVEPTEEFQSEKQEQDGEEEESQGAEELGEDSYTEEENEGDEAEEEESEEGGEGGEDEGSGYDDYKDEDYTEN